MPISDGRLSALLFAAAFLTRLVCCLGTAVFGTDGANLLLMAQWMREGRFHEALSVSYHPLYPLLAAAAGGGEGAGSAVSVLLGSAAVVPLFCSIRAIFGRPAAFFAALLYAFNPAIVELQSEAMTEGAYMFFLFSTLWLAGRMMEAPSLERGAVLGAAAAAAFLVRPEGILAVALAVAWPLVELALRRDRVAARAGGALLTVATILLLASPYLLWVKSERGRWGLSVRSSAISAEKAIAGDEEPQESPSKARLYGIYANSIFKMTALGVLVPFHLIGLASLRGIERRRALFYFSFPVGLLLGPLWALRTHDFMSGRYLMAGMTLLNALAGLGLAAAVAWLSRRSPRWEIAAAAFVLAVAVLPGAGALRVRRQELRSAKHAAVYVRIQGPAPRGMSGPVTQAAYYAGSKAVWSGATPEALEVQIRSREVEVYVYSERDLEKRPAYVAMLRSCPLLQPPVEVKGPPGTLKMYVQRVR